MKVLETGIVLVVGTRRFGLVGVLLAVDAPVRTCAVPEVATVAKGRTKVMAAAVPAVFETYALFRMA